MQTTVDWKQAPKDARWWAMDADGEAHWLSGPTIMSFTRFWFFELAAAPSFDFNGDWRKSLVERPAAQECGRKKIPDALVE